MGTWATVRGDVEDTFNAKEARISRSWRTPHHAGHDDAQFSNLKERDANYRSISLCGPKSVRSLRVCGMQVTQRSDL